eukprot:4603039-Pleurochrysis_carterae.AAC.2
MKRSGERLSIVAASASRGIPRNGMWYEWCERSGRNDRAIHFGVRLNKVSLGSTYASLSVNRKEGCRRHAPAAVAAGWAMAATRVCSVARRCGCIAAFALVRWIHSSSDGP